MLRSQLSGVKLLTKSLSCCSLLTGSFQMASALISSRRCENDSLTPTGAPATAACQPDDLHRPNIDFPRNCAQRVLVDRSVSQRCLLLIGDLVAELDPDVDELVRGHLLTGLASKVSDSKVVVRKAASQVSLQPLPRSRAPCPHTRARARAPGVEEGRRQSSCDDASTPARTGSLLTAAQFAFICFFPAHAGARLLYAKHARAKRRDVLPHARRFGGVGLAPAAGDGTIPFAALDAS